MRFLLTLAAGFGAYWWLRSRREERVPASSPSRAPSPVPDAPASTASGSDDLTQIKGIGPALAAALDDIGIRRFDQIAAWDGADIAVIDAQLLRFKGRIERDDWIGQAKVLAAEGNS